jgi:hypothetical protein
LQQKEAIQQSYKNQLIKNKAGTAWASTPNRAARCAACELIDKEAGVVQAQAPSDAIPTPFRRALPAGSVAKQVESQATAT